MDRISFSKYDAIHIYEYLRFYWKNDYDKNRAPQEIEKCGKFGCCPQCEQIGKRLENFIGKKEVNNVKKLLDEK